MSTVTLDPQVFPDGAVTDLPAIDFYDLAKSMLPGIYKNAVNFMGTIQVIATQKQKIYDTIRSLNNSYNLYNSGGGPNAAPTGIYLKILAANVAAEINETDTDDVIATKIKTKLNLAISRGKPRDFYNYFVDHGIESSFTNNNLEENGNATIKLDVGILNNPMAVPNPFNLFIENMQNMKGAGIKIIGFSSTNIPLFQLANDAGEVEEGNAGFAVDGVFGEPEGGGYLKN